jgi:hypothetical protein
VPRGRALAAGEPVHLNCQQHVNPACAGGGERGLQTGSVGIFGGGVVGERFAFAPPGLGGDVVIQPDLLRVQGIGLVFFVGGSSQVDTDPLVSGFGFGAGSAWGAFFAHPAGHAPPRLTVVSLGAMGTC